MTPNILRLILQLALSYHLDPMLIQAVIKTESNWNTNAIGLRGEVGLMQIMPEYSKLTVQELQTPKYNIIEGVKVLANAKRYCSHQNNFTYIVCFNRGIYGGSKLKKPTKDSYYNKVMEQYQIINGKSKN